MGALKTWFEGHQKSRWAMATLMTGLWSFVFVASLIYFQKEKSSARFEFFVSSHGILSPLQRENWLSQGLGFFPLDEIVSVGGRPFSREAAKNQLRNLKPGAHLNLEILRSGETKKMKTILRRYSPNDRFVLGLIPFLISILFFGFSIAFLFLREIDIHRREPVLVLSLLTWCFSLWMLAYLPALSLGWPVVLSSFLILFSVMVLHLFWVYPKEKMRRSLRHTLLLIFYCVAGVVIALSVMGSAKTGLSLFPFEMGLSGLALLAAFASVSHTLLKSRDFWARRRARLASFVLLICFTAAGALYWAQFSDVPHFSLERIFGLSLIFPSAFAAIFLKDNVFDLERLFRKGAHQLLLLSIGISLAVSLGWAWSEWKVLAEKDWPLWVSIVVLTLIAAKPLASWVESSIHGLIRTRVPYPSVLEMADRSKDLKSFLETILRALSQNLWLKNIVLAFPLDPSQAYGPANRQIWTIHRDTIKRLHEWPSRSEYRFSLDRGERHLGELLFEGGDRIAFDPFYSRDWQKTLVELSRALEILLLRDFVQTQQGLLAVGRMQALLAHNMKNPLAIIKVCAGLLQQRVEGSESEELVKTIQDEIMRVSKAVQSVFDQSTIAAQRIRFPLWPLLSEIRDDLLRRFSDIELRFRYDEETAKSSSLEMEREGLKQALMNLLTNACEAGATEIEITIGRGRSELKLEVTDNGPGIAEGVALFQPFSTTKSEGSGLGLLFVKAFVERHQGHIRVASHKGKGTVFSIEFSQVFSDSEVLS